MMNEEFYNYKSKVDIYSLKLHERTLLVNNNGDYFEVISVHNGWIYKQKDQMIFVPYNQI